MKPFERSLFRSVQRSGLVAPGDRIAVAVSGGADSVALLRLLHAFRDDLGIALCVAHFDHQLRDAESRADADFVAELSRSLELEFFHGSADVRAAAKQQKLNTEDAARRLRYDFFKRLVSKRRASLVAVAHTADDQAETVLARLLRGTGPAGLSAIRPRIGPIIRPLLEVRRGELRSYLQHLGQDWREDSTNADLSRQRAHIRGKLIPVIESEFSPSIVANLGRLARLARQDEDFWRAFVDGLLAEIAQLDQSSISLPAAALLSPIGYASSKGVKTGRSVPAKPSESPCQALTQRLIRECFSRVRGEGELSAVHVDQIIHLAASQSGRRVELPGGIRVENRLGEIAFARANPIESRSKRPNARETASHVGAFQYCVALPERGEVAVKVREVGTCFRLKLIDWPSSERETRGQGGVLDVAQLAPPLFLRSWQPGDAYRPCARRRPRKLKRMLLEARIPREKRAAWPVLVSRGQIVWARNMPLAEGFGAGKNTKVALVIEESPF